MLFNAAASYSLNKTGGYRDREWAQIKTVPPPVIRQRTQFGLAESEKVSAEQGCCNPGMCKYSCFACIKFSLRGCYLIT